MIRILGALLGLSLYATANAADIEVAARPQQIHIAPGTHQQQLNFDLIVSNRSADDLIVQAIELAIHDRDGRLVRREFVDRHSRLSPEVHPDRTIAAGSTAMIFNPFHTFAADVPLAELRYTISCVTRDGERYEHAQLKVKPQPYRTRTDLIVPLEGRVMVWDGHDYASHHRRVDYTQDAFGIPGRYRTNFQRYGYDFVLVDEQGEMSRKPLAPEDWYRHKPENNAQFHGFGSTVRAAGAGRVVDVHDGEPDNLLVDPELIKARDTGYGGNYIVIDHLNGEFSWFGHLQQNSIKVKVGEMVRQGEPIAAVGASGSSLFPHLHYELRNGAGAATVDGLPSSFSGFRRIGSTRRASRESIETGEIVDSR